MSRTYKTISTNAFERKHGVDYWWEHPGAQSRWSAYGQPTKGLYVPPPPPGTE